MGVCVCVCVCVCVLIVVSMVMRWDTTPGGGGVLSTNDHTGTCREHGSQFRPFGISMTPYFSRFGGIRVGTSVASFLVLGGARPPNVPTKKVTYMRERAKRASASETYIFRSQYTSARTQCSSLLSLMA